VATPMSADTFVAALKKEGVKVVERGGWRTHNRNRVGSWGGVNGVLIHHTAGRDSLALCYNGRSDLPGPLCHTHLSKTGVATMVGNGRANHAGPVARNAHSAVVDESSTHPRPSRASGTVDGNRHYYGIEVENLGNGKDPYPQMQYEAAVRWAAAICRHHGWSANSVVGHKETSVEGKIDPSFSMDQFRKDVAARLKSKPSGGSSKKPAKPAPVGGTYIIREGDTLWSIAAAKLGAGTRHTEIAKLNKLGDADALKVGQTLKLPKK
jgi:LysM repeat protein